MAFEAVRSSCARFLAAVEATGGRQVPHLPPLCAPQSWVSCAAAAPAPAQVTVNREAVAAFVASLDLALFKAKALEPVSVPLRFESIEQAVNFWSAWPPVCPCRPLPQCQPARAQ